MSGARPVGVFDSGIGGLSVWLEIRRQLPDESTVYLADQLNLPYGPLPAARVLALARSATQWLLESGCKAIVLACNTASAAALHELRAQHPSVPFIGMEPAVTPAAQRSRSRVVGVMATPGTLQGKMFADAVARFARGVTVVNQPCPGLVELIERAEADDPRTEGLLRELLRPIQDAGADTLVLACTHYPFLLPQIRAIVGPDVDVIDPAPAVARQLGRVLAEHQILGGSPATHRFMTTGPALPLQAALRRLASLDQPVETVRLWIG